MQRLEMLPAPLSNKPSYIVRVFVNFEVIKVLLFVTLRIFKCRCLFLYINSVNANILIHTKLCYTRV